MPVQAWICRWFVSVQRFVWDESVWW